MIVNTGKIGSSIIKKSSDKENYPQELDVKKDLSYLKDSNFTAFELTPQVFAFDRDDNKEMDSFNCFYSKEYDGISILIEEKIHFTSLLREVVLNFIDFTKRLEVKNLLLFIDKNNHDYSK